LSSVRKDNSELIIESCAGCDKPVDEKYSRFCSERCANLDLAAWLNGVYRIPADD